MGRRWQDIPTDITGKVVKHCFRIGRTLALLVSVLLLSACVEASPLTTTQPGSGGQSDQLETIVMTYLHNGQEPQDLRDVQAAVNAIAGPTLGVAVDFLPLSILDASTQYPLLIGTGETIDLMCFAFQNVPAYAQLGLIQPLNQLVVRNAPYISDATHEFPLFDGPYIGDKFYTVSTILYIYGTAGGYFIASKYLEEIGENTEERRMSSDELTNLLLAIKYQHPDMYPSALISGGAQYSGYGIFHIIDLLGATAASGALLDVDSASIVNLFESPEYYGYLNMLRDWQQAGLISPDAAVTDLRAVDLLLNGTACGFSLPYQPVMKSDMEATLKEELTAFQLTDIYLPAQSASTSASWGVPITSKHPDAAIRFLDLTFSNPAVSNTLLWGIEGKHYEIADAEEYLIRFPEGVDSTNSGYFNTYGLYGDRRFEYIWSLDNSRGLNQAYTDQAMANPTRAFGYNYDGSAMISKIANINVVMSEYLPALESGSADLDVVLPLFLSKLKAAGIDEVIADNQRQFDQWRQRSATTP